MKSVKFPNGGLEIAGNLYLPEDFDPAKAYAAIVAIHPSGGVKEQTAGLYAGKLAQQGFVALAYDASCQGDSTGEPRHLENPYLRVEDVSAAIDYLTTLSFVDNERIGVIGICAGGGYAVNATLNDRRIKALGTVSAVNYGAMYRKGWDGTGTPEQAFQVMELAARARTDEAAGGETQYPPTVQMKREEAAHPDLAEAWDYYRTGRAQHPNAPSKMTTRSLAQLATFDAFNNIEIFLTQPVLAIAGSDAGTRWLSEELIDRAASKDKELHIIPGGTHMSLYDAPDHVGEAMSKLTPFYKTHLAA